MSKEYSDQEFVQKVGDRIGNVNYFRKLLRESNRLANRQKLTDEHVDLFLTAVKLRNDTSCTWPEAFKKVLDISEEDQPEDPNKVEINELRKIVREQEVRLRALEKILGLRE